MSISEHEVGGHRMVVQDMSNGRLNPAGTALSVSHVAGWRRLAIFAVKLIHSLIFLGVAASILHVFYAGVRNRGSRLTKIALALALGESLVFAGNRFRCPLRTLAEQLGAESGQVTDIFLPRWLADRIALIFTPPLIAGVLGLLWHWRQSSSGYQSRARRFRSP